MCLRRLWRTPSPWGRLGWGLRLGFFPSPWGRLGWCLWWTGRTPGNSYRVAAAYGVYPRSPSLALQRERIEPISQTFTMGCEFILVVFEEVMAHTFPLRKTGVEFHFATAVTLSAGSYLMIRELVPYVTWPRALCYESSCLMIRSRRCGLHTPRLPFRAPQ